MPKAPRQLPLHALDRRPGGYDALSPPVFPQSQGLARSLESERAGHSRSIAYGNKDNHSDARHLGGH